MVITQEIKNYLLRCLVEFMSIAKLSRDFSYMSLVYLIQQCFVKTR